MTISRALSRVRARISALKDLGWPGRVGHRVLTRLYQFSLGTIEAILFLSLAPVILAACLLAVIDRPRSSSRRVLVGIKEIANNIASTSTALRKQGWSVESVALRHQRYDGSAYDVEPCAPAWIIGIPGADKVYVNTILALLFCRYVRSKSTFVFVWNKTFLPGSLDLFLLRAVRKEVVIIHCGDEVRYRPIHYKIDEQLLGPVPWSRRPAEKGGWIFVKRLLSQKVAEWTANAVMTSRDQATFLSKNVYHGTLSVPKLVKKAKAPKLPPLIIHAPSSIENKATVVVLDAIQQLKKDGICFEFELIHQRDNSYVLSRLQAADIVVDQQSSWFGRFAIEGMASGCVVISGYRPGYNGKEDVYPVINFPDTAEDLASLLQSLVENPERRREQMRQSYECWREFYSEEAFASYLEAVLEGLMPNLKPRKNAQDLLLQYCENGFQRLLVRALCH